MAEVSPLAEFLGQAIYQFEAIKPLLPTYGHLLVAALFPIYIGTHASLARPSSAQKPPKKTDRENADESDDEEEDDEGQPKERKMEGLAPSDALMFPLSAGAALGVLYLAINWIGTELLNKILGFYFSQMGAFFAMTFMQDALQVLRSFVLPRNYSYDGKIWRSKQSDRVFTVTRGASSSETSGVRRSPLPGVFGSIPLPKAVLSTLWACRNLAYQKAKVRINLHRVLKTKFSVGFLDLVSLVMALSVVGYFAFVEKTWWLTNFLGFSFCYGVLQVMTPSTFVTGSLVLGSLFFYDIYFVYFTPLMVTVAKNLDVPIKLLFPRPADPSAPDAISLAMLGLGDIVVPGMMVGLALRFDLYLYYLRKGTLKAQSEGEGQDFVKPIYQSATGGWGERFWTRFTVPKHPELEPPYHDARYFPKTYFRASVIGYIVGMIATLVVMQCFDHPQPALLYLVPGVLISLWGTAVVRGEYQHMWDFTDGEDDDEEQESDEKGGEKQEESSNENVSFFRRIFGGHDKPDQKKSDKSSETDDEKKSDDKASDADSKKDDKEEDLDLFSISLYLPRKAKSTKTTKSDEPKSPSSGAQSIADDENWDVIGSTGQDNEPPAKRRRRSPRNLSKATDEQTE